MSLTNRFRNKYESLRSKSAEAVDGAKSYVNKKTLSLGEKLSGVKSYFDDRYGEKYNKYVHEYRVKKYEAKGRFKRKWEDKWSVYVDYVIWSFTPFVVAYGLPINFALSQLGLWSLSLGHAVTCGLGAYAFKVEFPEWINGIDWMQRVKSSEV